MAWIDNNMENCEFQVPSSNYKHELGDFNLKIWPFYSERLEFYS